MSSSVHANNKTRNILVLNEGFTYGLVNTTIYAEKFYSTNFTVANKNFCSSLHYNGDDNYIFVNAKKINNFVPYPLCLGGLSKDFSPSNTHRTGLGGYVYDFSVDYWAIAADKILDIYKYLMKKKQCNIKFLDLL